MQGLASERAKSHEKTGMPCCLAGLLDRFIGDRAALEALLSSDDPSAREVGSPRLPTPVFFRAAKLCLVRFTYFVRAGLDCRTARSNDQPCVGSCRYDEQGKFERCPFLHVFKMSLNCSSFVASRQVTDGWLWCDACPVVSLKPGVADDLAKAISHHTSNMKHALLEVIPQNENISLDESH